MRSKIIIMISLKKEQKEELRGAAGREPNRTKIGGNADNGRRLQYLHTKAPTPCINTYAHDDLI